MAGPKKDRNGPENFQTWCQRILTKFEKHATLENLKKSGRPRRNDDISERILIQDTRCHPKKRHVSFNLIGEHLKQHHYQLLKTF